MEEALAMEGGEGLPRVAFEIEPLALLEPLIVEASRRKHEPFLQHCQREACPWGAHGRSLGDMLAVPSNLENGGDSLEFASATGHEGVGFNLGKAELLREDRAALKLLYTGDALLEVVD